MTEYHPVNNHTETQTNTINNFIESKQQFTSEDNSETYFDDECYDTGLDSSLMQNILGRVVVIFTSCLLIFIVPLLLITLKQDDTTQAYVTNAVTEFVDKSRATGHISVNNYEELIQGLDATGILYEIKINHYSSKELFIKSEILDVLYSNSIISTYEMQLGDYLQVEVYNKTATLRHKVLSFFSGELRTGNISCVYGGYVGSNIQK